LLASFFGFLFFLLVFALGVLGDAVFTVFDFGAVFDLVTRFDLTFLDVVCFAPTLQ